ncbi:hypothetical protein Val02_81480 [Virgisporangium aliadipatigenens]|uniref:Uncharacterized protein n=1 Tax=Virgisporangium aliadipatigenens TaxID=741659 RepID=A0A8J3YVI2_9ACTN|nr:hypothetical protein [Virgisporangium aliadipatigenens]GIJ51262.1 hypothetical protein Val02_81480 [Virgisporangium aliadipatigenens]
MSNSVPPLLVGLLDDAAMFPPGSASLTDALATHRLHRAAWYSQLVGPLMIPAEDVGSLWSRLRESIGGGESERLSVGLLGPLPVVAGALAAAGGALDVRVIESPIAKRGEDPMPGVRSFLKVAGTLNAYAEVPLTWGLLGALDALAEARAAGQNIGPKFRTGGLAAELFPTPVELAAVICACRDRDLPFKLTAGLHHALRHTDPETGFLHHGFLNVLAGAIAAADGAEAADVAEVLASTDAVPLVETVRLRLDDKRPLWVGYGTCSVGEPLSDMRRLGLLPGRVG